MALIDTQSGEYRRLGDISFAPDGAITCQVVAYRDAATAANPGPYDKARYESATVAVSPEDRDAAKAKAYAAIKTLPAYSGLQDA